MAEFSPPSNSILSCYDSENPLPELIIARRSCAKGLEDPTIVEGIVDESVAAKM